VARSAKVAAAEAGEGSDVRVEEKPLRKHLTLPDLDRLIHERVRLGVVSALAANEALPFVELKRLVGTSDGNLSVHARKLEEAGYIACTKSFRGRTPRTEFRLTPQGRRAFERYLEHLAALIRHARSG
jgi:DNA-binding transcriptional ArsR family regulator